MLPTGLQNSFVMFTISPFYGAYCRILPQKIDNCAVYSYNISHLATTLIIIGLNLVVVATWAFCFQRGMSATAQLFIAVAAAILCIILPYPLLVKRKR